MKKFGCASNKTFALIKFLRNKSLVKMNEKHAFTLIELLIVIVIIGILMSLALVSYQGARKSSRDAKRKADLQTIAAALEKYKSDKGYYPYHIGCSDPLGDCHGSDGSDRNGWSKNLGCNDAGSGGVGDHPLCVLTDGGYIDRLPIDPGTNFNDTSLPNSTCGKAQIYFYDAIGDQGSAYKLYAVQENLGSNCDLNCDVTSWLGAFHICQTNP